jgi:hypothetical protein
MYCCDIFVVVRFVDIGEIDDHHFLNFLFIIFVVLIDIGEIDDHYFLNFLFVIRAVGLDSKQMALIHV